MQYKQYGKTGKKVSVIGFGGMRFGNPGNIEESAEIVLRAHEKGINYFDTAPVYCGDNSEDIFGTAFKHMERSSYFVSTKSSKASGSKLRADMEKSLRRLGVDKIDFYHIWCLLTLENWELRKEKGAVREALKAKEEGLVDHVVLSSHLKGEDLAAVLDEGFFEGVTLGYCAFNFPYREKAVEKAGKLGLGVVTMNPLGGGLIPGNPDRFSFLKTENDRSVVEAALRFNVSNPNITCALVGFSNKDQVDEAVSAVENFVPYPEDQIGKIKDHIIESFDGICTGCGYCMPCPSGVNIPQMMDVYNRKILEGKDPRHMLERLQWHWSKSASHAALCTECGVCETRCTQKLPIQERLKEIASLDKG